MRSITAGAAAGAAGGLAPPAGRPFDCVSRPLSAPAVARGGGPAQAPPRARRAGPRTPAGAAVSNPPAPNPPAPPPTPGDPAVRGIPRRRGRAGRRHLHRGRTAAARRAAGVCALCVDQPGGGVEGSGGVGGVLGRGLRVSGGRSRGFAGRLWGLGGLAPLPAPSLPAGRGNQAPLAPLTPTPHPQTPAPPPPTGDGVAPPPQHGAAPRGGGRVRQRARCARPRPAPRRRLCTGQAGSGFSIRAAPAACPLGGSCPRRSTSGGG